ncbi:hypothetical protein EF808_05085 [archaeon]|nr:MAG: hypothetical protein EF808_05085 [archaeon]
MVSVHSSTMPETEDVVGERFPQIRGHALDQRDVTLPDDAQGMVALIVLAFERQAQSMVDSWIGPFERHLCGAGRYTYFEVPMIAGLWGRMFSRFIDDGMRAGVPEKRHHNVVTYYGNFEVYSSLLALEDRGICYAFLLDKSGFIRWRGNGYSSPEEVEELVTMARMLHER